MRFQAHVRCVPLCRWRIEASFEATNVIRRDESMSESLIASNAQNAMQRRAKMSLFFKEIAHDCSLWCESGMFHVKHSIGCARTGETNQPKYDRGSRSSQQKIIDLTKAHFVEMGHSSQLHSIPHIVFQAYGAEIGRLQF